MLADGLPAETVPALLRHNSKRYATKPAVISEDTSISHAELDEASHQLARRLVAAGVDKSSRVGLMQPNGVEWVVIAAAVMRVGATLVPLSTLLRPPELALQLTTASVTELILVEEFRGRSYLEDLAEVAPGLVEELGGGGRHAALPALRHLWISNRLPVAAVGPELVDALEGAVRPADDVAVLFTSGSRGIPKGVIHTHGNALRATQSGLSSRTLGPEDRLYIPMPFFWTGGFSAGVLTTLVAGCTLVTEAVPEPERSLALLQREQVTLFRGWPDQAAQLAAHPKFHEAELSDLRPGSLAAILPRALQPQPGSVKPNLFGMTETFGPYCGARLDIDLPKEKWGSCGRPFDGVEVRIFEPGTDTPCPPGTPGEIAVRGANVMRAICGRTREQTFTSDGFYPTGDLGVLDADGYLWYQGRSDDMFKVKGATVYPSEVEAALRSIEGVRQVFVTNVPSAGDAVGAVVVADVSPSSIAAEARHLLSSFKMPTRWYVTPSAGEVPRSATGKVTKDGLQRLLDERGEPAPALPPP